MVRTAAKYKKLPAYWRKLLVAYAQELQGDEVVAAAKAQRYELPAPEVKRALVSKMADEVLRIKSR